MHLYYLPWMPEKLNSDSLDMVWIGLPPCPGRMGEKKSAITVSSGQIATAASSRK